MANSRKLRLSASFWEATRIAVDSLRTNKLRSFLTLLGIILATTTLIAVTALIHGMNLYIADKVSNMGADGFRIVRMAWFGPWDPKKFFEMQKRNPQIKPDEYEFLKDQAKLVKDVGMMTQRRARVVYKGESMEDVNLQGVTDNIPAINNVQVETGRSDHLRGGAPPCAGGFHRRRRAQQVFRGRGPHRQDRSRSGRSVRSGGSRKIAGQRFRQLAGQLRHDPDRELLQDPMEASTGIAMVAKAIDQQHLQEAQDECRVLLRAYRHLGPGIRTTTSRSSPRRPS